MVTKAEQFAKQQDALKKAWVDINKYNAAIASWASTQDALKAGGYTWQQAKATNPVVNTSTANKTNELNSMSYSTGTFGYPTEYQWTWTNKANSYQNQWEWTYKYDEDTKYYEKQDTDAYSKVRDKWDSLTYAQQQEKLKQNPNLKAGIEKAGWTFKTEEATPTTWATWATWTKTETTPKQWEWDYQSDSPERMAEIAANLEWYKQTMPYLFNDKRAFDDFFINWKGRSQAQIDFLNQWFENNQKYSKYDALTPDSIWYWIAYWDIPEDYLTMLKTTDPAKYQAALQAKQDAEDKIKDRTALDTTNILSWDSEATITSKAIEWLKSQWLFLDKDWNLIDDRTENYATDEEKQYAKDAADIIARNLDIDNTVKHTYEDLVKAYPWATKATLMAMAQDRNADLLREKENNNVELTRLQWYMNYLQTEREDRTEIWQKAIEQLQKQYWMYYTYSPEWMSELAQTKYAATNVTLDQADNGTDTQKQIALQRVLDDYYAKYWDIIQRSEAQVINDVIALAKQKGISLSQALEENFLKYLRQKPWFEELSTIATKNPEIVKIWDNAYAYWDDNWNLVPIWWATTWTWVWAMRTERNNNPTAMTTDVAKSLWWIEWVDYIQWDSFKTWDGRTLYTAKLIGDPIETTIKLLDNAASSWRWAFYTKWWAKRWTHTAMSDKDWLALTPEQKQNVVLQMLQREGWDINKMAWYNQWLWWWTSWWLYNPNLIEKYQLWSDAKWKSTDQERFWKLYWDEIAAEWVSKEQFMKQYDEWYEEASSDAYLEILQNLDHLIELTWKEFDLWERVGAKAWLWDVGNLFNYIKNNLTLQALSKVKWTWVNLWILSDSDVEMVAKAASALDWDASQESWNYALNSFREQLLWRNKYLKDKYKYQSAYSPNRWFKYNNNDKSYTFWTRKDQNWTQWATQWTTTKTKSIKNLWK